MSADSHSQKLFGDLVVSALRARMSRWCDGEDDYFTADDVRRISSLENRMSDLASDVSTIKDDIKMLVSAMAMQQNVQQYHPHQQFFAQHPQQQVVQPHLQLVVAQSDQQQLAQPQLVPFAQHLQQKDLQLQQQMVLQGHPQQFEPPRQHLNGSSSSSPGSPSGGYAFRCPVCMKPQYTPKSHCNHMRRLADPQGYCFLRSDVPFHNGILRVHRSAPQFISWYTQRLRSSMGTAYTQEDIRNYEATQEQLRHDVHNA
jgi:hypothetical protein